MAHPGVAEATVVGLKHLKWQERPAAFVVPHRGSRSLGIRLLGFLEDRVAKWWMPDKVIFIDQIPKTGTGKFDKKVVRDQYADLLMEESQTSERVEGKVRRQTGAARPRSVGPRSGRGRIPCRSWSLR